MPLYVAGARILELFQIGVVQSNVTLGVGVLSYAGRLNFDILGDADPCPDLAVFGSALASGDFNHDSFADLAAGAPGHMEFAGAVSVLQGSAAGVTASNWQLFTQGAGVAGAAEPGDGFGFALTAGSWASPQPRHSRPDPVPPHNERRQATDRQLPGP